MPAFLSQALDDLTHQMAFTPPERRRVQMDRAEDLYWQTDPDIAYPLDYVIYRITGYRPDASHDTMLVGAAVRRDLLLLVDQLSATLQERIIDYDPRPIDQPTLSRQLGVTAKTISRYRRQGLFTRRLVWPDGKQRVAFLPGSVQRFLAANSAKIEQAGKFSRMDDTMRHKIITRARRIAGRVEVSMFRTAEHLAKRTGRSTEAVRRLLLENDKRDPRVAIFPDHTPPLSEKQQRVIHRAYHRGIAVSRLVRRFRKTRTAIYRSINRRRAAAIGQLTIRYVTNPMFNRADADEVILDSPAPEGVIESQPAARETDPFTPYLPRMLDAAPLNAADERTLFVRFNYLKFRADALRKSLDPYEPSSTVLDRIETYLRRAVTIKHQLVRSNMRLIVSVARKHQSAGGRAKAANLSEMVSEGSLALMEAIETFDPARGNRFSTYLTWALMRRFAQMATTNDARPADTAASAAPEDWPEAMNPDLAAMEQTRKVADTLTKLLANLDERERLIITRHFGLSDTAGQRTSAQSLAEVARELGVSAERARQIEHRAMKKLRAAAGQMGLSLDTQDLFNEP